MSFFEDYVEDGLCCMCCGEFIDGNEPGYPRYCESCQPHTRKKKNRKENKEMKNQENMKIISVVFEDNKEPKKFNTGARKYSYYTKLQTLEIGDIVDCLVRQK